MQHVLTPIAFVRCDFKEKFGTPRQSGLTPSARAEILFEPEFRGEGILRGIEGFSHLWLIFIFHENLAQGWRPTVRPPRLGGNERLGVFATRSPFRPNGLGLSVVKLEELKDSPEGKVLVVSGLDLMHGTPIVDIKPYVPSADALPEAKGGFTDEYHWSPIAVEWEGVDPSEYSPRFVSLVEEVLALSPKPAFHDDPERIYGVNLGAYNVRWRQVGDRSIVVGVDAVES